CWIAVLAIAEAALRISRGTKTTFSYWGMVAAHLGLAVTIVGIAFSQNYSVERDVRMKSCWIAVLAIAEAALRISRGTKTTFSYWGMVAAH
ncbi:cytochrome c-type biogenesis CcmF C-terminal domain-containing protein, partial [Enterobacter hormaechei]|uniref:cytochrome c-type biogenesis CcmF C-terminal domain-containing protein n=1 Tax=Enterobacter hormaechei TaxID=158836 RepID=UPI001F0AD07D